MSSGTDVNAPVTVFPDSGPIGFGVELLPLVHLFSGSLTEGSSGHTYQFCYQNIFCRSGDPYFSRTGDQRIPAPIVGW